MAPEKKIPFMVFPNSILSPPRKDLKLIDLLNEILVMIMGYMEVIDSALLALSCKHMVRIGTGDQTLDYDVSVADEKALEKVNGFFNVLEKSWVPSDLRQCYSAANSGQGTRNFGRTTRKGQAERLIGGSLRSFWLAGAER